MFGKLEHELELHVPASEAWDLFGGLGIGKLVEQECNTPSAVGMPGPACYKEKFTKIDNEKHIKETQVIEGGYLELGFTFFRVILEVIEKGEDSSIIKSTIEYELKEEEAANASLVSIQPFVIITELAKNYLIKNKAAKGEK